MARAFTLVEMMIVVAIVMILAAIAIPSLAVMQLRAKRSEAATNSDGVMTAYLAYHVATDTGVPTTTATWPRVNADKKAVAWVTGSQFDLISWRPDGAVRCVYQLSDLADPPCANGVYMDVLGGQIIESDIYCDVDDDNVNYTLAAAICAAGDISTIVLNGTAY